MFKAIGRWGSQVKSGLAFQFITNIFGSKSKRYDEIDSDGEEEEFLDAQEDLTDHTDSENVPIVSRTEDLVQNSKSVKKIKKGSDRNKETKKKSKSNLLDVSIEQSQENAADENGHLDLLSDGNVTVEVLDGSDTENHHCDTDEDDEHHIHNDKQKMVKSPKRNSSSSSLPGTPSAFKKVHRRISSYTQRQYAKLDPIGDEEPDTVIRLDSSVDSEPAGGSASTESDTDILSDDSNVIRETNDDVINVFHSADDVKSKTKEEKGKRKRKIPKKIRKNLRGSWKWLKRGMLQYAQAFNSPTFFVINTSGSAVHRRY